MVQPFWAAIHAASTLAAMPPRPCSLLLVVFTILSCTCETTWHVEEEQDITIGVDVQQHVHVTVFGPDKAKTA